MHTNQIQTKNIYRAFFTPSATPYKYLGTQNNPTTGKIT